MTAIRGFTTFQALVVVLLSGIAVGVAFIALRESPGSRALRVADELVAASAEGTPESMRRTAAKVETSVLLSTLKLYRVHNKRFPTEAEGLAILASPEHRYLERVPTDPWGRPYLYANPGKTGEVDVFSVGPDGVAGTNDDIGTWQK